MKFHFPQDKKTETLNISIYEKDIKKVRKLAEVNKCTINDIYKTLISEALEEYEEKFGDLEQKEGEKRYSVKRDFVEAGDNKRKEVLGGEQFDGGGDQRTREETEKNANAVALGSLGGIKGGPARAAKLSSGQRSDIAKKAARARWNTEETEKLPKDWYKKENLAIEAQAYLYCANPNCKNKYGKFLKGQEIIREGKTFCSTICADQISPDRKPLPENFVYAYCNYILCEKKKYTRSEGIEAEGKNFCSEKCYADWTESTKKLHIGAN